MSYFCGKAIPIITSKTIRNLKRSFYGCSKVCVPWMFCFLYFCCCDYFFVPYLHSIFSQRGRSGHGCDYFLGVNPPIHPRSTIVMNGLLKKIREMEEAIKKLKHFKIICFVSIVSWFNRRTVL